VEPSANLESTIHFTIRQVGWERELKLSNFELLQLTWTYDVFLLHIKKIGRLLTLPRSLLLQ
jgi:hypothetical protein